jgi:outer membrane protein insertion porin family
MKRSISLALILGLVLSASPSPAAFAPLRGLGLVGVGDTPWVLHGSSSGEEITIYGEDVDPDLSGTEVHYRGRLRGGPLAPVMSRDGVLFRYRSRHAESISVVGEFNDWDVDAHPMRRSRNDVWRATIDLDAGSWTYLFVVDGEWLDDPDNPVHFPAEDPDGEPLGDASLVKVRRDEVVIPRATGYRQGSSRLTGSYDRVDQIALMGWLEYENRAELHPDLTVGGGYSFGRDRWLYSVGITQPLFEAELLDVGAKAYRITDTPDRHRMSDLENSLATFFFREDWRDYHEAEGVGLFSRVFLGPWIDVEASWKDEDHRSVSKTTDWGLFGGDKRMRANLPVDEGTLRAAAVAFTFDTRNSIENPSRGWLASGTWEQAGGELGGDFEFRRRTGDLRRYLKLSPGHYLDLRVAGGILDEARRDSDAGELADFAAIPVQERFYLGGVGTMRATQFKSITGDRMLLGNAEVRVDVSDDIQIALFCDVGDAWIAAERDPELHTDAGVGFQDADGDFRLNVAKKLDRDDDSVFVTARIRRMF